MRRWVVLAIVLAGLTALPKNGFAQAAADANATITNPPPPSDDSYRRELQLPYRDFLKKRQLTTQDRQLADKVVHYLVYQLVAPGKENQRNRNMSRFQQDIRSTSTTDVARQYILEQSVHYGGLLLNDPSLENKVVGAHWLCQINIAFSPDVPFHPASKPLLRALELPNTAVAAKVVAAKGLGRILKSGEPPLAVRLEIMEGLAKQIHALQASRGTPQAPETAGYQFLMWNLTAALGNANRVYNSTRQPVVTDALMAVLADTKEDWLARATAAHALSRLPFEANADLAIINYETAKLTHDMAVTYNANIRAAQPWPLWRRVAIEAYLAYEAESPAERTTNFGLANQVKKAPLAKFDPKVREARDLIMPIVNSLTKTPVTKPSGQPPVPQASIDALAQWLAANTPTSRKVTPESQEPPAPAAAKTAAAQ